MRQSGTETVLVTGGASGIGVAVVEAALERGWRAIVADRDEQSLVECRAALGQSEDAVRIEQLDVADEAAVVDCVARCDAELGRITGVVNSAGIGAVVPALETSLDLFRRILEVSLLGSFVVSREAGWGIQQRGVGSIVNITSVSGLLGNAGRVAYGASKGAVVTMTQVMAVELAPHGIRVNAIAPGSVETPLVRAHHSAQARASWNARTPQGRYGEPSEIAQAAIFLLDRTLSGYLTGQTIAVDGGFMGAGVLCALTANALSPLVPE
jgi:NAD(P)-dependent dehydrogenase (short-subunit alcohol dehydrogenase family)